MSSRVLMQEHTHGVWRALCGESGSLLSRSRSMSFSFAHTNWTQGCVGSRASTPMLWVINILSQLRSSIPTGPSSTVFLFIHMLFILKPTQPGFYTTDFRHQGLHICNCLFLRTFHLVIKDDRFHLWEPVIFHDNRLIGLSKGEQSRLIYPALSL